MRCEVTPRRVVHVLPLHAVDAVRPLIAALTANIGPPWAVDAGGEPRGLRVFSDRAVFTRGHSDDVAVRANRTVVTEDSASAHFVLTCGGALTSCVLPCSTVDAGGLP